MRKLLKYLKPFTILIIVSIVLLLVQALADLALPDYMSDIVNTGIQQGGIENSVPDAMRKSQMDKITIFMSGSEKEDLLSAYTLVENKSNEYAKYIKIYPLLEKEPVYILKEINNEQFEKINSLTGMGFLAVAAIKQAVADPSKAAAPGSTTGLDLSKIPEGITEDQIFSILAGLPESRLSGIREAINNQFGSLGDRVITQMTAPLLKKEYEALGRNTAKMQSGYVWKTGFFMLLLSLLSAACAVIVGYLSARTAAGVSRDLRRMVFSRVESFSNTEFDRFSTASLITRTTNDITQVQMLIIVMMRIVFYAPIMGIGGIIRAVQDSVSMSWIIAVAVIVIISLMIVIFSITMPRFRIMQNLVDRLNLVTRENLSGMMVIRAFNTQKFEEGRFDRANADLTGTSLFINRIMVLMMPVMMLIMNGLTLLIVWVGAHQVSQSSIQVGDMMAFMQYAMLIIISFLMISVMFIMVPRASVSASRVAEVLETESVVKDPLVPKKFTGGAKGEIEFRNVSFRYPEADEDVLHEISFKAGPGRTTAIIGPTGSGKSTIANLILRFYDVNSGQILVDGLDVREVLQGDLRTRIGYVPQKSVLFSGTVESNLLYADENAGMGALENAAAVSQAMDFIDEKPEGFKSEISQGGKNLSGGQNQRLSIARALVKVPKILILDDCFSALDFKTDKALRRALKLNFKESTILIVAQRVGTVMNSEQIIVIDEGRIAGMGTHKELMEICQIYREIALSQLSREELS